MEPVKQKILQYMRMHNMLKAGELICVGISGGADSLFLLKFLHEIRQEKKKGGLPDVPDFQLMACHINHHLRGEEGDADQTFTEQWCKEKGIFCRVFHFDIQELSRKKRCGMEEAGRAARRQAFSVCIEENHADKIALAHHQNDQAETVLFHLARGSGLAGISGILPFDGTIIRPLLCISRSEIEESLKKSGESWKTDSTNLTDEVARNRMRNRILPLIAQEINTGVVRHLAAAAEDAAAADRYLRSAAEKKASAYIKKKSASVEVSVRLSEEDPLMQQYLLRHALGLLKDEASAEDGLRNTTGGLYNISRVHIEAMRELLKKQPGSSLSLPDRYFAVMEYEGIRLCRQSGRTAGSEPVFLKQEDTGLNFLGWEIQYRVFRREKEDISEWIAPETYTKCFDYDKIKHHLQFRTRRQGDFIRIDAAGNRKKLKAYFVEEKIPRLQRDILPVLASEEEIWWVPGYRMSEAAKLSGQTRSILQIRVRPPKL